MMAVPKRRQRTFYHEFWFTLYAGAGSGEVNFRAEYTVDWGSPGYPPSFRDPIGEPPEGETVEITKMEWKIDDKTWSDVPDWVFDGMVEDDVVVEGLLEAAREDDE